VSRVAIRVLAGMVLFACLAGPAPGHVGGCGGVLGFEDPTQFCYDKSFYTCEHEYQGGRASDADHTACLQAIEPSCTGAAWPSNCHPTQDDAEGCINLLRDASHLDTPADQLLALFPGSCDLCRSE